MENYQFYGWEQADVPALTNDYPGIRTPWDLYNVLSEGIWRAETCAPRLRGGWTRENKTLGQCSITAFLVQEKSMGSGGPTEITTVTMWWTAISLI